MSLRAIPEAVAAATREEIPILSLREAPKRGVRESDRPAHEDISCSSGRQTQRHRAAEQPQALALDAARCAAVRDGSSRGGHRLRCEDGTDPDRARGFALSVLHPRGSGRCRPRRAGTGPAGHRPQRRPRPLRDHGLSEPYGSRSRQRRCIRPDRGRHGLERRATKDRVGERVAGAPGRELAAAFPT